MPATPSFASALNGQMAHSILGPAVNSEELHIVAGYPQTLYRFHHVQDCCESCKIVAVQGEVFAAGHIISCVESDTKPEWCSINPEDSSHTWSVYTFTIVPPGFGIRNQVVFTVVFLGESNGYYSEDITIDKIEL